MSNESVTSTKFAAPHRPNIIFILADDLGYGDVGCFNADAKIATPHMDALAAQGMRFTDAHTSSAVCTPSRYSLLTGRYNWRTRLQGGVLGALSPHLIEDGRLTVAQFLREQGYHTTCIGKWHLGMDWAVKPGRPPFRDNIEEGQAGWNADFNQPIQHGPTTVGFDSYFGVAGSLDMVPYTFIEDDHLVELPSVDKSFPMMLGRANHETRRGPGAPDFEAKDVLPLLAHKASAWIEARSADARAGHPFFLYLPLTAPHTPIAPTEEWQGTSGLNPYGDFVQQTDDAVGAVLAALDHAGLAQDTLVVMTSDNGCSEQADFQELQAKGHFPSGPFRGDKASIFEGGHRVPFIVRWPGRVKAGAISEQVVCLMDFMATCADILQVKFPDNAAEDSVSLLPEFTGTAKGPLRETLVHHSINGSFAIRAEQWKAEFCPDSGGWCEPKPGSAAADGLPPVQLYDLSVDIGETHNVQAEHPEIVERLRKLLEKQIAEGRSTPGTPQQNAKAVRLYPTEPAKPLRDD